MKYSRVVDYEDYWVYTDGTVFSEKSGIWLKPALSSNGYLCVSLWREGKSKTHNLHAMVARAFIENPNGLEQVNHKDGDKLNNKVENLEWVSRSDNTKHAYKLGLMSQHKQRKAIEAESVNGGVGYWYPASRIAEKDGFNSGAVTALCKHGNHGRAKTHKGHFWNYC